MVYIIMGVSGCGKTTVGQRLADRLRIDFHDADDFHSEASKQKMASGIGLTDEDRQPWLARLADEISDWNQSNGGAVLACSALKQAYRDTLALKRSGVRFVYLQGDRDLIAGRLASRSDHFFNADLLDSQFDTLEPPTDAIVVSIDQPVEQQVQQIVDAMEDA